MKNPNLGRKIKDARNSLGLSQDQLADQTQLSLRTIQRIENGETDARGDTLTRIAKALNFSTLDVYEWTEQEDNSYITLINLSALTFIVFPLLGIILPVLLWLLKRGKIRHLDQTAKRLINFQISWCLLLFSLYLWIATSAIFKWENLNAYSFGVGNLFIVFGILYLINLLYISINTFRSVNSKAVLYKPAIPIFR